MTGRQALWLATFGSVTLMAGALAFQYIGGMPPCKMCYWQRYPHIIAIAIGALALGLSNRMLTLAGAAAALTTSAIGFFHAGVERGFWEGPTSCTSASIGGLTADELFDQIMAAPIVRCDEIPWEMLGLSMAGWNAVISLALACLWLLAWRRA
ncbi:disulfide bond formation protein B [uncultured Roseobacter sp.]|uniref:disulfide bond formation protein B n=1 Tax=uncultured Roseobacter sp. TaxID=114847 RepID=UPI00261A2F6A|nr:disulfide bond formation protein B [uncultured Roseobacter sp.]